MSGATTYRTVLLRRDFRMVFTSQVVSQLGDWLYNVALLVFVYEATGSAGWVAATTFMRLVPYAVLGTFGGVVADRYERTAVIMASDAARAALMCLLTWVVLVDGPALAAGLLAALTTAVGTAAPPSFSAMVPELVPETELATANALKALGTDISIVVGPAFGAVLLLLGDPAYAFAINALTFLLSGLLVSRVQTRSRADLSAHGEKPPGPLAMAADGVAALRSNRAAALLTATMMAGCILYGAQTVQLVLYAQERLGLGEDGYGYLLAAMGVGGVLAATVTNRLAARARLGIIAVTGVAGWGACTAGLAASDTVLMAALLLTLSGMVSVIADVVTETSLQRSVPPDVLGRVFGVLDSLCISAMIVGALVAPVVIELLGVRGSLVALGSFTIVVTLSILGPIRRLDAIGARRYEVIEPRLRVIRTLDLFANAPQPALEQLAAAAVEERALEGTVVVAQGQPAEAFYAIVTGSLEVTSTAAGEPEVLRTLSAGDYFGEIGLLERIPRTATVTALTDVTLYRIDGATFIDALTADSSSIMAAGAVVAGRLARSHPSYGPTRTSELAASAP